MFDRRLKLFDCNARDASHQKVYRGLYSSKKAVRGHQIKKKILLNLFFEQKLINYKNKSIQ